jgi:uncharacterized protein with FMN-binding domain
MIAGTVAGLVAVLEFHTTPAKLTLAGGSALPPATASSAAPSAQPSPSGSQRAQSGRQASASASPTTASSTATGPHVNYNFGVLAVKITVSGGKISKVGVAYLNDGGNPRSQYIDQQAIPILEQQALQAQSANIQGVSGASYTSAGFTQSLQSALHTVGM